MIKYFLTYFTLSIVIILSSCKPHDSKNNPPSSTSKAQQTIHHVNTANTNSHDDTSIKTTEKPIMGNDVTEKEVSLEIKNNTITEDNEEKDVKKDTHTSTSKPSSTNDDIKTTSNTTNVSNTTDKPSTTPIPTEPQNIPTKEETKPPKTEYPIAEVVEEIKNERPEKPIVTEKIIGFPNHKILDGLLRENVSVSGKVNYAALKSKEALLDKYLAKIADTEITSVWRRNQKLAYWINVYNAYTIKLILNNYPINSIKDLHNGKPWDHKWIKINGKTLSLNNIEHDIIRPEFNEPRIHFAVNCAAVSCPPIMNSAYTAKSLNSQLESQTKKFINNTKYNILSKDKITISKIFDWYESDFGDIGTFITKYANTTIKPSAKIEYKEYDWALNK